MVDSLPRVLRSLFGGRETTEEQVQIPISLPAPYSTPQRWIARAQLAWPHDYAAQVDTALRYLRGQHLRDTTQWLREHYGDSAQFMTPAVISVFRRVVLELARVYGQEGEEFPLLSEGEGEVDPRQADLWSRVRVGCELDRKLKELERHTVAAKRMFVRVGWNSRLDAVRLTLFSPTSVFPIWIGGDDRHLSSASGVLLAIEPTYDEQGRAIERWEFWSAERTFTIDSRGRVDLGTIEAADGSVTPSAENPYGQIPIVAFAADEQDTAGYYALPDEQLLSAQRVVNAVASDIVQTHRQQGYGQLYTETVPGEAPGDWAASTSVGPRTGRDRGAAQGRTIRLGPTRIVDVPRGRRLGVLAFNADVEGGVRLLHSYLSDVITSEGLPPGSVLADSRTAASGTALLVERQPLTEARRDLVEIMRPSTRELLELVRLAWNTHRPTEQLRLTPDWVEGTPTPPISREERRRADEVDVRLGIESPVTIVMRDRGLEREAAVRYVAERQAEGAGGRSLARLLEELLGEASDGADVISAEKKDIYAYEVEGGIFTIDEIRGAKGWPPRAEDGQLTVPQYRAKHVEEMALATVATTGGGAEKILRLPTVESPAVAVPAGGGLLAAQVSAPTVSPLTQARGEEKT